MDPINFLTVDLEDYFQVHAFSNVVKFEDWGNHESRIERNTHRLLEILNGSFRTPHSALRNGLSQSSVNSMNSSNSTNPSNSTAAQQNCSTAARYSPRATFFCLGWIAEQYPHLIRTIKKEGHEIACHGYAHKLIYNQSKDEFREDIKKAKAILEDVTGDEVIGYRAPSYSITDKSQWAFEVLMQEGFKYDSSIFPIHHDFYGFPQAPRFPFLISTNGNSNFKFQISNFKLKETQSSVLVTSNLEQQHRNTAAPQVFSTPNSELRTPNCLLEFPLSTVRICGQNLPISGGGYFRLFPYPLIKRGLRRINEEEEQPFMFYIHPWELDPDQPRINSISRKSRFRHYVNLNKTESKFKKLLGDFRFSSIQDLLKTNISNAALQNSMT